MNINIALRVAPETETETEALITPYAPDVTDHVRYGVRPGVVREDLWDWHGQPYYISCGHYHHAQSLDPRYTRCLACQHSWSVAQLAFHNQEPQSWRADPADESLPHRVCVTCERVASRKKQSMPAQLPAHHLNVCHRCGGFVCYPHTFWYGGEDSKTLCGMCRRGMATSGEVPKGFTLRSEKEGAR